MGRSLAKTPTTWMTRLTQFFTNMWEGLKSFFPKFKRTTNPAKAGKTNGGVVDDMAKNGGGVDKKAGLETLINKFRHALD